MGSNPIWGTLKLIKIWSSFFAIPDFFLNFAASNNLNNKSMKKFIMAIVCLMTMVLNVSAQDYYNHFSRERVNVNDDMYNIPLSTSKKKESFWNRQQLASIGANVGCVYVGDKSYFSYGVDFILGGALMGIILSDAGEFELKTGFQFGYFIPVCKFGKEDGIRDNGWDKALLISPLIEFNQIIHIDGHYLHKPDIHDHHNCQVWIDTSYATSGKTGYGIAILYRFGCGNLTIKATTLSIGASIGVGI